MPRERFDFLVYSLEELHEHLKEELARNPFLEAPHAGTEESEGDELPPPQDEPEAPS